MDIQLFPYLIKASICMTLCFALYRIFLHKHTHFIGNRIFFVGSMLLSISIPLIEIPLQIPSNKQWPELSFWTQLLQEESIHQELSGSIPALQPSPTHFSWEDFYMFFVVIYGIGVAYMMIRLFRSLFSIVLLAKKGSKQYTDDYVLITTNLDLSAFSFFHFIYVGKNFHSSTQSHQKQIISHELAHIQQFHSLDICLFEVLGVIFWFNPFTSWMKKTLQEVHEFSVDSQVSRHAGIHQYARLLIQLTDSNFQNRIANHFAQSHLTKRIHMLLTQKSSSVLLFIPPVIIGILLLVITNITPNLQAQQFAEVTEAAAMPEEELVAIPIETDPQPNKGAMPIKGGDISSDYGMRMHDGSRKMHFGIDFKADIGTPVYAVFSGKIARADSKGKTPWGQHIVINHEEQLGSIYAHLSEVLVKYGQQVKKGELIGRVGSTGRSKGPHLHFGIKQNGKWVDPVPFLPLD